MRILAIADEESKYLWDYFQKEKLEGIDLILSSGDLNPNYLSFLATFTTAPVLYVRGNHDDIVFRYFRNVGCFYQSFLQEGDVLACTGADAQDAYACWRRRG